MRHTLLRTLGIAALVALSFFLMVLSHILSEGC